MKILEVELTNMRTFQKAHYRVPTGLSLITGPNGSGKTTLQGVAAGWAIWGQAPGRSQDYLVRHGERDMTAKVLIQVGRERYSIERRFLLAPNGKGGTTRLALRQFTDGKSHDLTQAINKETQAKINDLVGTFEVWNMTAYVGQREGAGQFLEADAYTRKTILREILSAAGDWDAWEIAAKEMVKAFGLDIAEVSGAIPVFEDLASALASNHNAIDVARGNVTTATEAVDRAVRYLASVQEGQNVHEAAANIYKEKAQSYANRVKESDQATRAITDLDNLIAELNIAASKREDIEELYEAHQVKITERQAEISVVMAANKSSTLADTEALAVYETAMATWRTEHGAWIAKRDARMNEIRDRFVVLKKVKIASESLESKFCPECKQELTDEHAGELKTLIAANSGWESEMAGLNTEYGDLASAKPPDSPEATPLNVLTDTPRELGQDVDLLAERAKSANALVRIEDAEKAKISWVEKKTDAMAKTKELGEFIDSHHEPDVSETLEFLHKNTVALAVMRDAREAQSAASTELTVAEQKLATSVMCSKPSTTPRSTNAP